MNLEHATLEEARDWLRPRLEKGAACPLCTQHVQTYRRRVNSGMAVSLIHMYRAARLEWQHIPTTVGARSREEGKLRYWGLVEEQLDRREDGGHAGWWRVTKVGERWIRGLITIPKYAVVYDAKALRLEGDRVSIIDALGNRFDYRALMDGRA